MLQYALTPSMLQCLELCKWRNVGQYTPLKQILVAVAPRE